MSNLETYFLNIERFKDEANKILGELERYIDGKCTRDKALEIVASHLLSERSRIIHSKNDYPNRSKDDPSFSVDVICADQEGMLNIGCYNYKDEEWVFHTDTLVDPYEFNEAYPFVWMYKPDELEVSK